MKSLPKIVCSNQIKSRSILILQYFDDAAVQNTFIVMDVRIFFQFLFAKYNVELVLHFFAVAALCHGICKFKYILEWPLEKAKRNNRKKRGLVYQTTPHIISHNFCTNFHMGMHMKEQYDPRSNKHFFVFWDSRNSVTCTPK